MKRMPRQPNEKGLTETISRIKKDRAFRIGLTSKSHQWFFMTYLGHHMTAPFAPFHGEIFRLTENPPQLSVVVAFRGSGKSTIISLSYAIWAALTGRKKFILVISKTETQAKQILYNIKSELEGNRAIIKDFGRCSIGDIWNESSLVLPRYGARISALSADSSLRGLKNRSNRPDLIILDDVEDTDSVRSSEVREKRYRWLKSEVIPAGSDDCTVFVVGNLLHEDSLVSRLKDEIASREIRGVFRSYAVVDKNGAPTWPGKYPDATAIEDLKLRIGDIRSFKREYLQEIVPDRDQVVLSEWIKRYEAIPDETLPKPDPPVRFLFAATGVDLAISQRESADYTAMVSAFVYQRRTDGVCLFYILPIVTNRHLSFEGIVQAAKTTDKLIDRDGHRYYVEDVAFQRAAVETFRDANLTTFAVGLDGLDKRSRLSLAARQMELGRIFFPKRGCEDLIRQLTGFGAERHDDLADAFSLMVNKVADRYSGRSSSPPTMGGSSIFGDLRRKIF